MPLTLRRVRPRSRGVRSIIHDVGRPVHVVERIISRLQWHLDRPQRLAGITLSPEQQERLHMALMSGRRELVAGELRALPFIGGEDSVLYISKLAGGSWSAEFDAGLRRTAARMLPATE